MWNRLLAFLVLAIVVPGCFDNTPTDSTSVPGSDTILKAARLSGRQEVPPNASAAVGDATVAVRLDRLSMTVTVNFSGLVDATDAHIHVGGLGVDGPILFPLASGGFASPLQVTLTQDTFTPQPVAGIFTFSDGVNAVLEGRTYVNLHSAAFPGGEIRGQVGPVTMLAQLDGQQEAPPVVTAAFGSMSLTMNNEQTSMTFSLDISGLSNLTAAHIHAAPAQVDGPILFPLAIGVFVVPLSGERTPSPEEVDAVLSGNTYVNVHTALYPDGEIRGQILGFVGTTPPPVTTPPTFVPPTVTPPIPGYPIPGVTIPSTQNPGLSTPGSPGVGAVTTGTTVTTAPPSVTVIGPYGARQEVPGR